MLYIALIASIIGLAMSIKALFGPDVALGDDPLAARVYGIKEDDDE